MLGWAGRDPNYELQLWCKRRPPAPFSPALRRTGLRNNIDKFIKYILKISWIFFYLNSEVRLCRYICFQKIFLSKICSLAIKSGLMPYLTLDYQSLENDIVVLTKSGGGDGFTNLNPSQKLAALCTALQKGLNLTPISLSCLVV